MPLFVRKHSTADTLSNSYSYDKQWRPGYWQ